MKLKNLLDGTTFHVSTEIGKILIAAAPAVCCEYVEPPPPHKPVEWRVRWSDLNIDPPYLSAFCPMCNHSTTVESEAGTAHETIQFRHGCSTVRGVPDTCPADVAEKYIAAFQQYFAATHNKPKPKPKTRPGFSLMVGSQS